MLALLITAGFGAFAYSRWRKLKNQMTRREQAEQMLRESEQRYRNLIENAPVGIVVSSFDGRVLEVNDTLVRMHGYQTKEEFAKTNVADRFQDLRDRERWVAQVWGTGKVEAFEVQSKRKDGSLFWSSLSSTCRKTENGEQEMVTVIQDVTERKEAKEALHSSELRYESLFAHMAEGLAYCQMLFQDGRACDFVYLDVNPKFEELTGLHGVVGKRVSEVIPGIGESNRDLIETYGRVSLGGKPEKLETYLPALDMWLSISAYSPQKGYFVAVFDVITDRKLATAALEESEGKYRDLVENAPVGIILSSLDGQVLEANETLWRMHGYETKEQFIGSPVADRYHDLRDRERWVAIAPESGKAGGFEVRLKRRDGDLFWASITAMPCAGRNGEKQLLTIVQDVTERRKAEDNLAFKTALLEAQSEATMEGVLVSDDEGGLVLSNKRFRDMWQIPEGLMKSQGSDGVLLHTSSLVGDAESFIQKVRHFRSHRDERGDDAIDLKDGRIITRYTAPLFDAQHTYRGRVWYFRDITEPRRLRAQAERASGEWRRTFDSISDMVSIQDKDFRLVMVNKAYSDAFKMQPQEVMGRTCYGLVHGTDCPMVNCPQQRTLQTGLPAKEEFFEPHLGIYLEVNTSPLCDEKGEIVGTVHVARDVTKRREMEKQLMLADRLVSIGELASGVAHELNNPLTTVIGFSELLMERDVPDDIKKDLDLIHGESKRAAGIVKNLLTFARGHELAKQAIKIGDVVESVLRLREYEQRANNITVVTRLKPDLPEVMADFFQMQQVFLNLVINAEFFMTKAHNRGTLTIVAGAVGGMVRISFTDDGPGIPPEALSHLFNPFFTTKEVGKGTGLGLSICHGIVTEHGGTIYAENRPGEGATFCVELPAAGQPAESGSAGAGAHQAERSFGRRPRSAGFGETREVVDSDERD